MLKYMMYLQSTIMNTQNKTIWKLKNIENIVVVFDDWL